ncbi:polyprenyl synthetase family protein [Azotobacter vinelandii]|uniref:polyprenyl synthetase family protein n=1 Tax=Azotobacter vinelandii TaxID=354 RepID=UPI000AB39BB7|nr:polyprenyl synthetase family protein [Azotobacter vinelandii]WKN20429.1 polyprenyl synthetase family protein [Azotobacter vinelandii]
MGSKLNSRLDQVCASSMRWLDLEVIQVRQAVLTALRTHTCSEAHRRLLEILLLDAVDRLQVCHLALRVPLLVADGVRNGIADATRQLTAALTILEAGIYTLDHIMDREVEGPVAELPPGQILLGATSMISHVPYQILSHLRGAEASSVAMLARFSDGLARIAAGQLADIAATTGQAVAREGIEEVVRMKTGERRALYAALAAQHAGATPEQVEAYAAYGRALGIARQLRSDLQDLFGPRPSRDLSSGTATLPIALLLERTDGSAREEIQDLLRQAMHDTSVHASIRAHLRSFGVLRDVVKMIEANCRRALAQIEALCPPQRSAMHLREFVLRTSVLAP